MRIRHLLPVMCIAAICASHPGFAQDSKKKDAKKDDAKKKKDDAKKKKADAKKKQPEKKAEKQPAKKKADSVTLKHLVSNLENPSGVTLQPKTGHVFVATRYGIYRYVPADHKVSLEIDAYATDVYGKGTFETSTKFNIGPLGVAFMNDDHLVVGDGSRKDGEELVRIYKIGSTPAEVDKFIDEGKAAYTIGPIKPGEKSPKGEGNFFGVAVGAGAIFVTCNGDDTKGWVARAELKDGKPGTLEPTIATKEATGVDAPVPIAFSPDGKLVVGQMGEMNVPEDSLLTIYDAKTGKLEKKYKTGLSDICGIAYHPKTKKLYATDFGWMDAAQKDVSKKVGGLYELTIDGDKVTAKKIVALDKPAALAFDSDGKLYITAFNTKAANDKSDTSPGALYVIEKGL
jgi:DNA-binding beta-propeller fold protein YncE